MPLISNITGPQGPQAINLFRPENYDSTVVAYGSYNVSSIVYSYLASQVQRVDFTYTGDQLTTAVVKALPSNTVVRTVTYTYTGDDLTGWTVA